MNAFGLQLFNSLMRSKRPPQCKEAVCMIRVTIPDGYRPIKWNDPVLLKNIEGLGFLGFVNTVIPESHDCLSLVVPMSPEKTAPLSKSAVAYSRLSTLNTPHQSA